MTDTLTKPAKAVASDINIAFFGGMVTLQVDLLPVKDSVSPPFHLACPECDEATQLSQKYVCPNDPKHGPYDHSECHHTMKVEGTLRKVTDEEMEDAKTPLLPKGNAEFNVYPSLQVLAHTLPGGAIYRLRPKTGRPVYSMLVDLLSDPSLCAIAELTNRGTQKMYRCLVRDNILVLMELVRPDEIREPEPVTLEDYPDEMLDLARDLVASQITEFDPSEYHNAVKARVAELGVALLDPKAPKPTAAKPKPKDDTSDVMAMLQAGVAAAKKPAKKATAKKATAKKAPAKRKAA